MGLQLLQPSIQTGIVMPLVFQLQINHYSIFNNPLSSISRNLPFKAKYCHFSEGAKQLL
jgi:hypothetical protein